MFTHAWPIKLILILSHLVIESFRNDKLEHITNGLFYLVWLFILELFCENEWEKFFYNMNIMSRHVLVYCVCRCVSGGNPPGGGVQAQHSEQGDHGQQGENPGGTRCSVPQDCYLHPAALRHGLTHAWRHRARGHRFHSDFYNANGIMWGK